MKFPIFSSYVKAHFDILVQSEPPTGFLCEVDNDLTIGDFMGLVDWSHPLQLFASTITFIPVNLREPNELSALQ